MSTTAHPSGDLLNGQELRAWRGMLRAHALLTKALDHQLEAEHGIPLSSYEVLMYLQDAPGHKMRMSELASSVILSRSGLTRLVDRLEREGLIKRESCETDARGQFAKLTATGTEKVAAARATHLAGVRRLFLDVLTTEQQDRLGEIWDTVAPGAASAAGPA